MGNALGFGTVFVDQSLKAWIASQRLQGIDEIAR
jgi:hypothetical protein